MAGHADHAAFQDPQVSVSDEIPFLHEFFVAVKQYPAWSTVFGNCSGDQLALESQLVINDLADCFLHLLYACWNFYVKSGFSKTAVTWGDGGGRAGTTQCVWGRGDARMLESRRGVDGVPRVQIPGFS